MKRILLGLYNRKNLILKIAQVRKSSNTVRDKGFNFDDARLMRGAWRNEPNSDMCKVGCFYF